MKIQCNCGAKYSFDVTPEMARSPIRFVCQTCGQDSSELVNQLIRQQLGVAAASAPSVSGIAPPVAIAPPPAHLRSAASTAPAVTPSPSVPPPAPPRVAPVAVVRAGETMTPPASTTPALRVSGHATPGQAAAAAAPAVSAPQTCAKHPGQLAAQQCRVCGKPMCPKCMASFGYVCSAYCKGKAENQGISLPVYAGQRQNAESRQTRKLMLIVVGVMAGVTLVLAAWGWYAWVGSVPKVAFSLRLPEPAYSGQLRILPVNQAVYLHGGTLARYDMKGKKEVWSNVLIDKKRINEEAKAEYDRQSAVRDKIDKEGGSFSDAPMRSLEEILDGMLQDAAAALRLHVRGGNVWVSFADRVTQFEWDTGKPAKELPLSHPVKRMVCSGDELLLASTVAMTGVNLLSGETRTEQAVAPGSGAGANPGSARGARTSTNQMARTGGSAATSATRPGGSQPAGTRSQYLSTPARIAAPAAAASSANQQRLQTTMNEEPAASGTAASNAAAPASGTEPSRIIADREGAFQVSAAPLRSGQFQVAVRRLGKEKAEWSGEMPGWPDVFSLKTVDVVTAGKSMVVIDRAGKKRWDATLTRGLSSYAHPVFSGETDPAGAGPVVEQGDTLYLYDSSELMAFDLASGSTRWRFESAGTSGLFFDDRGMIYVNTTTASPGSRTGPGEAYPMVFKVDSKTGKALWQREREGQVAYVSGKFVYAVESYAGDKDVDGITGIETVFTVPAFVRVRRFDPENGRILWSHHQPRFPLDVQFDKNSFHVLFKREVQVLKFISL